MIARTRKRQRFPVFVVPAVFSGWEDGENTLRKILTITTLCVLAFSASLSQEAKAKDAPPPARAVEMQKSATVSVPAGTILIGPETALCDHASEGALRYSLAHKTLMICDGTAWKKVKTEAVEGK